jgi:hypothetical protein
MSSTILKGNGPASELLLGDFHGRQSGVHMLSENKNWQSLKEWAAWSGRHAQLEVLITGVVLPVFECIFVNLLTGAEPGKGWPYAAALVVFGVFHLLLLAVTVFREKGSQVVAAANAVEAEEKLAAAQDQALRAEQAYRCEIDRRTECHRMIREAIVDFNLQTCQINPTARNAFCRGISPIIRRMTKNVRITLGVPSNEFTIEIYCNDGVVSQGNPCGATDGVKQEHFLSHQGMDPCAAVRLGHRSPYKWGLARMEPGICRITDDQNLFFVDGKPAPGVYFSRFATVPITQVCTSDIIGVLVLTSMQTEDFAGDVLDTLQFISTLISQYIAYHNRCVEEWWTNQRLVAERRQTKTLAQPTKPPAPTAPRAPGSTAPTAS